MMKKIMVTVALLALVFAAAYGDGDFTVQTVNGRVEKEGRGGWTKVAVGEVLSPATVIRTGIDSSLELKTGERIVTVKAVQNGQIGKLAGTTATGIRIDGSIAETDTAGRERSVGRISTNSARANDAKENALPVDE
jgi:hypothetical protein